MGVAHNLDDNSGAQSRLEHHGATHIVLSHAFPGKRAARSADAVHLLQVVLALLPRLRERLRLLEVPGKAQRASFGDQSTLEVDTEYLEHF